MVFVRVPFTPIPFAPRSTILHWPSTLSKCLPQYALRSTGSSNPALYDIELTKEIVNCVSIPVIASGGCGKPDDMITVFKKTNVEAALAASIFHYETHSVDRVKEIIKESGIPVRI